MAVTTEELAETFVGLYGLEVDPASIPPDETLFGLDSPFGLDSMDTLKFIALLHERHGFDLGTAKTETFRTLHSIQEALG